jgi:hypothetical protein
VTVELPVGGKTFVLYSDKAGNAIHGGPFSFVYRVRDDDVHDLLGAHSRLLVGRPSSGLQAGGFGWLSTGEAPRSRMPVNLLPHTPLAIRPIRKRIMSLHARTLSIAVCFFLFRAIVSCGGDPQLAQQEFACRQSFEEVRSLAKDGCSQQLKASVRSCIKAGAALGLCVETLQPAGCLLAAVELTECNDAAGARKECQAKQRQWKTELARIKNGDCFAVLSSKGDCLFVCKKQGGTTNLLGILDLTQPDPQKAFKFFAKP